MKGHYGFSTGLQAVLNGSPSDEDEEEDDATPDGTTEAEASDPSDASRPRAELNTLSSSALVKHRRHLSGVAMLNRALAAGDSSVPQRHSLHFE